MIDKKNTENDNFFIKEEYYEKYNYFESKVESLSSIEDLEKNISELIDDIIELNVIKYNDSPK